MHPIEHAELRARLEKFSLVDTDALAFFIELHGGLDERLRITAREELVEIEALTRRLIASCHAAHIEAARRQAHDLTGLAAAYGLDRLAHAAEAVCITIRSGQNDSLTLLAVLLGDMLGPSIAVARSLLGLRGH